MRSRLGGSAAARVEFGKFTLLAGQDCTTHAFLIH